MRVVLARNCGNDRVERIVFTDPYRAMNFYQAYCGKIAAIVECEKIYTIGSGKYADENCFYCPLHNICVCQNRKYKDENDNEIPVRFTDCSDKS